MVIGSGYVEKPLSEAEIRDTTREALARADLAGKRVLVIVPDGTRTAPIPLFFRLFHELLWDKVAALDYLIALGTHQPMDEAAQGRLFGVSHADLNGRYAGVGIFNHRWDLPGTFATLGTIPAQELAALSNGLMAQDVRVDINKLVLEYDQVIICGPVFPHEVVGFSGGHKYFFPGVSGGEVIEIGHWLAALITNMAIIGTKETPVRRLIDRAASFVPVPTLCFALVTKGEADLGGLYVGAPAEAWSAAADLSAQLHIAYVERPFRRVLSVMPRQYDDLWTASKGVYKLEPAVADGGEVVIYAPHVSEISYTHGRVIDQVGYHVRDYFVKQWEHYRRFPWCVLGHCTLVKGAGSYDAETGIERYRMQVTLATGIPRERCEALNLGYLDPASIDPEEWANREDEGILLVRKAGEMLYRVR